MKKFTSILPRWIPTLLVMTIIFLFSSRPSDDLPNFLSWDYVIKKTAHVFVYGLLAGSILFAFDFSSKYRRAAWLLAILYAVTDEFHQSFVPGRHSSIYDVLVFDHLGVLVVLYLHAVFWKNHK